MGYAPSGQVGQHKKHAITEMHKRNKTILRSNCYYRKFVPRFADISRPLTRLTRKETAFNWKPECQKSFDLLKSYLCGEPILKYADRSKPYTLYTDARKYGWAGVLTQSHATVIDGQSVATDHPVTFVSGLLRGSQVNWAALMKEAFAIYMSVKKLSFYLDQAEILLRSDHLPLKKFLQKNTLNSKVNNWAIELESFNIQFEYIQGSKNVLTDTLSRLIGINQTPSYHQKNQGINLAMLYLKNFQRLSAMRLMKSLQVTRRSRMTLI